jgi:hypothetical protein
MTDTITLPYYLESPELFEGRFPTGALWVNVHTVTRHYGGPEEGGWWYDDQHPVTAVPVKGLDAAVKAYEHLSREYAHIDEGHSRYSVLAGEDLQVSIGDEPAQFEGGYSPWE